MNQSAENYARARCAPSHDGHPCGVCDGPPLNRATELRSVANSVESLFPDAADLLRGIAREMDGAPVLPPGWGTE